MREASATNYSFHTGDGALCCSFKCLVPVQTPMSACTENDALNSIRNE